MYMLVLESVSFTCTFIVPVMFVGTVTEAHQFVLSPSAVPLYSTFVTVEPILSVMVTVSNPCVTIPAVSDKQTQFVKSRDDPS